MHAGLKEIVLGHGHVNVLATHRATIEFTKEMHLSKTGDCIVAIGANKAVSDLGGEFRRSLTNDSAKLTILIEAGGISEEINAQGSSRLILTHTEDMVIRKSDYVCSRTLAVRSDKAAIDLSRELVERLKDPKQVVKVALTVRL